MKKRPRRPGKGGGGGDAQRCLEKKTGEDRGQIQGREKTNSGNDGWPEELGNRSEIMQIPLPPEAAFAEILCRALSP